MKKMLIMIGGSFLGVGIIMLIVSFVVNSNSKEFFKTAEKTEATIERIDSDLDYHRKARYKVYVSYQTMDGDFYKDIKLGYHTSGMREGQSLTVYYNPQNPTDVRAESGDKVLVWIMGGLGCVFAISGAAILIKGTSRT